MLELLKNFDDEFIVYGFHKDKKEGNLLFKKFMKQNSFRTLHMLGL
jgi:hypothetical protein